jgi:hypothetical protein
VRGCGRHEPLAAAVEAFHDVGVHLHLVGTRDRAARPSNKGRGVSTC